MKWFLNEEFSDFAFIVEGKRIPVNKTLLAIKSDVFRVMFKDGFKESSEKEISVEGTTYDAFKIFIRFIYTDEVMFDDNKDSQLVSNVCQLADKYQVLRFFDKLAEYYKNRVTSDNMEWLYEIAKLYKITELVTCLNSWIAFNFEKWYRNDWSQLSRINNTSDGQIIKQFAKNFEKLYNSYEEIDCYKEIPGQLLCTRRIESCKFCQLRKGRTHSFSISGRFGQFWKK